MPEPAGPLPRQSDADMEAWRAQVVAGLRNYFDEHPQATRQNIGSVAKRIMGVVASASAGGIASESRAPQGPNDSFLRTDAPPAEEATAADYMVRLGDVLDQLRHADIYGTVPAGTPWRVAFATAATVLAADMDADTEVSEVGSEENHGSIRDLRRARLSPRESAPPENQGTGAEHA